MFPFTKQISDQNPRKLIENCIHSIHSQKTKPLFTEEELGCLINGNLEYVKRLVNVTNVNSYIGKVGQLVCGEINIFHFLSKYNPKPELIKYLLDIGGDVEKRDCFGNTSLSIACTNPRLRLVTVHYFVSAGTNLNAKNKFNSTALHHLCSSQNPNLQMIDFLVKNGANVNCSDLLNGVPLDYILSRKVLNFPIIQYLIENGLKQQQPQGQQKNEKQQQNENEKDFNDDNTDEDEDEDENDNDNENVNENENENDNDNESDQHSCICENEELSRELIDQLISKKDIIQTTQTIQNILLRFFCRHNHINFNIISYLVELGADLRLIQDKYSPLLYCCEQKKIDFKIIPFLVQNGCRINARSNVDQSTPLHLLCSHDGVTPQVVNCLIQSGAKINKLNQNMELPIHKLCENENFDLQILKALVLKGSNFLATTKNNLSLLHLICQNPFVTIDALKYLLNLGLNINLQDDSGNTAFHYLSSNTNVTLKMVKLFIKFGTNINQKNNASKTPFYEFTNNYWEIKNFYPIFFYLLNHGAKLFKINNCGEVNFEEPEITEFSFDKFKIDFYLSYNAKSFNQDFKRLFELQELTDFQIKGIKMHKEFVELRTNSKINKVYQILKKYKSEEIKAFMYWVYCDEINNTTLIINICKEFNIYDPEKKYLKKDLRNFYKNNQKFPKDFQIVAHGEPIKVHKLILQARSDLFRSLFLTVTQNMNQIIDYSKKRYNTIQALVKFLYTDELDLTLIDENGKEELEDCLDYYQLNINSPLKFLLNYHFQRFGLPSACLKLTGIEQEKEKEIMKHFHSFGKIMKIAYQNFRMKTPYYLIQYYKIEDAQKALGILNSAKSFIIEKGITVETAEMNTTLSYSVPDVHLSLEDCYHKFKVFGDIQNIEIKRNQNKNIKSLALIKYYYPKDAQLAYNSLIYSNRNHNDNDKENGNDSSNNNNARDNILNHKYIDCHHNHHHDHHHSITGNLKNKIKWINPEIKYESIYIYIHEEIDVSNKNSQRF